ncbi:MAG: class I SAM-dependent methyltransferase [Thermoleophilia bacterium]|nr:class I SAM-dependent methyltransferase [Thermoleophilia bacterium]
MSLEPTPISTELAQYILDHAGGRDDALRQVEDQTAELGFLAIMQTAPEQAAFLEMLVRLVGAKQAVEVGTFTGYGAIRIARGLAEGGSLLCCELDPDWAATARENLDAAGVGDRVEIRIGPAMETLKALPDQPTIDFAYLDADKTGYPNYYEELVSRLRPGGLLAIDNVFMGGAVLGPEDEGTVAMAGLNDRIPEDERVDSVMLGMADGLTLVRRTSD